MGWRGKQVSLKRFRFLAQCIDTRRDAAFVMLGERLGEQVDVRVACNVTCEHGVLELRTLWCSTQVLLQPTQLVTACAHPRAQCFGPFDIDIADGSSDARSSTRLCGSSCVRARHSTAQGLRKHDARHRGSAMKHNTAVNRR